MPENNELSQREIEILSLVAKGASNKEIAHDLHISTNTVKVHLRNIFTKVEVNSRTEAAMYAVNAGIVQAGSGISEAEREADEPGRSNRLLIMVAGAAVLVLLVLAAVLASQGVFSANPVGEDQIVIPVQEGWETRKGLSEPRKGLALASYDGEIYAFSGEGIGGTTSAAEKYDPVSDTWLELASKPVPVSEVSAAVIAGKIYLPGGLTPEGEVSRILEIYSTMDGKWERGADLPVGISGYALVAYEGNLYLFGGWDGTRYLSSVYRYDPETDRWTEKTPLAFPRAYSGAAESGGKIYVVGGYDGSNGLSSVEVYIPELDGSDVDPWSRSIDLPASRYGMGVAGLGNMIHVVGGVIEGDGGQTSLVFSPQDGIWQEYDSPTDGPIHNFGLVPLETHLYLVGGEVEERISAENLTYQAIYTFVMPIIR